MIIILDLQTGNALNFKYRKDGAKFLGVSLPTLRGWVKHPFFLYRTFIITSTGNGKIEASQRALHEMAILRDRNRNLEKGTPAQMGPELSNHKLKQ